MKNKYLLRISIAFLMMISLQSKAETYETALGLRLSGFSSGISLKHFTNPTGAVEGILSFGRHSLLVTGLYESHKPFPNAEGLSWFYGGGAHIGFINSDYGYYYFSWCYFFISLIISCGTNPHGLMAMFIPSIKY